MSLITILEGLKELREYINKPQLVISITLNNQKDDFETPFAVLILTIRVTNLSGFRVIYLEQKDIDNDDLTTIKNLAIDAYEQILKENNATN